jgi:plastocyanin
MAARLTVVCVLLALVTATTPDSPSAATAHSVAVKDDYFSPSRIRIDKGDKVIWRWRGGSSHDVTGGSWGSSAMQRGTYAKTFRRAGTYRYVCTLHPGMGGRIIVD